MTRTRKRWSLTPPPWLPAALVSMIIAHMRSQIINTLI
jgi:hypothetical protein